MFNGLNNGKFEREHSSRNMRLQDVFLNSCRREKARVNICWLDGSSREGVIVGFDNHTIILEDDGCQMLMYKNGINMVKPLQNASYVFNDAGRNGSAGHFPAFLPDDDDGSDGYAKYPADFS